MSSSVMRPIILRAIVVATLTITAPIILDARLWADEIPAQLSAYMDAAAKVENFNGSVLVAKDGQILFAKGYGLANAEHEIPNTPETKFRLGSLTKQFTATAILILQDQDKLKVEDLISKYLTDAPTAWEKITIHHLLTHTSGIPSYTDDPSYGKLMTKQETVESMLARFKDKPLEFEPGSKFHYDNSGYFLLGAIIEKVSGKSYEAFLNESIFEPLGMADTGYDRHATVLSKRASGYDRGGKGLANAPYLDMNQPYAAGALYSTVGDLFKWDRALQAGKPVSKEGQAVMFTPFKSNYAYGWSIGDYKGHKQIGHGGGINGFATHFQRYPADDVCVAVLCNVVPANPSRVSRDLARIVFGETVSLPKTRVVAKVDPKIYDEKPTAEDSISVTVVGTLRTGIVAIGGETTGTTITAKEITWELEFGKNAELRKGTGKFDGKKVIVRGSLERRAGIEVKERCIVTVTGLEEAGNVPVGGTAKPTFHATVGRADTRIQFVSGDEATIFEITSGFGIDKATVERLTDRWPKSIIIRLHLKGLESFKASHGKIALAAAASRTDQSVSRVSLLEGSEEKPLDQGSPYWIEVRYRNEGSTIRTNDGYFQITMPEKFFEGNPRQITLQWIDFYRN